MRKAAREFGEVPEQPAGAIPDLLKAQRRVAILDVLFGLSILWAVSAGVYLALSRGAVSTAFLYGIVALLTAVADLRARSRLRELKQRYEVPT